MLMRIKKIKEHFTRESVARNKMIEIGPDREDRIILDGQEFTLYRTECHCNSITMLMRGPEKNLVLCQALIGGPTPSYFFAHSFLVETDEGYILDYAFGREEYLAYSIARMLRIQTVRKARLFTRDKVLYWLNKTGCYQPYDAFHQKVDNDPLGDWSFLEHIHEDCPLAGIASGLSEDKIQKWMSEEEFHLYQNAECIGAEYQQIGA